MEKGERAGWIQAEWKRERLTVGDESDDFIVGQGQDIGSVDGDEDLALLHPGAFRWAPCRQAFTVNNNSLSTGIHSQQ